MVNFNKRTTTSFGLSIGTGLMLESIYQPTQERYDSQRAIPNKVNTLFYKYHMINMVTIVRNIIQSFDVKIDPMVILKDRNMLKVLLEEIGILHGLYSMSNMTLVLYYNDILKLSDIYNKGKDRSETHPLVLNKAIHQFLVKSNLKAAIPKEINVMENVIKLPQIPHGERMLLTTHIPCDLCNKNNFDAIDTHTGILYGKDKFYRKYNSLGNKDMSNIPFDEKLLYVIGDKNLSMISTTIFRAYIQEYSIKNKWNYLTSRFSIDKAINDNKDLREFCKNFKPVY